MTGKAKSYFAQASGEYTKRIDRANGVYFVPQAQFTVTAIKGSDYMTSSEVGVSTPGLMSYRTRLGFVLGQQRVNPTGMSSDLYLAANVFHEFGGNRAVNLTDGSGDVYHFAMNNKGTWGSVGVGYRKTVNPLSSFYVDYVHTVGGQHTEGAFHIGAKHAF